MVLTYLLVGLINQYLKVSIVLFRLDFTWLRFLYFIFVTANWGKMGDKYTRHKIDNKKISNWKFLCFSPCIIIQKRQLLFYMGIWWHKYKLWLACPYFILGPMLLFPSPLLSFPVTGGTLSSNKWTSPLSPKVNWCIKPSR